MYDIKEVTLRKNEHIKKRPVIIFHEDDMSIVAEFLMTDAPLFKSSILNDFEEVMYKQLYNIERSGNRTHIQLQEQWTTLSNLFDEADGFTPYRTYMIATDTLYELTKMWFDVLEEYQ